MIDRRSGNRGFWRALCMLAGTKKGVPFLREGAIRECILTGGTATLSVRYKGRTYPVCCSG